LELRSGPGGPALVSPVDRADPGAGARNYAGGDDQPRRHQARQEIAVTARRPAADSSAQDDVPYGLYRATLVSPFWPVTRFHPGDLDCSGKRSSGCSSTTLGLARRDGGAFARRFEQPRPSATTVHGSSSGSSVNVATRGRAAGQGLRTTRSRSTRAVDGVTSTSGSETPAASGPTGPAGPPTHAPDDPLEDTMEVDDLLPSPLAAPDLLRRQFALIHVEQLGENALPSRTPVHERADCRPVPRRLCAGGPCPAATIRRLGLAARPTSSSSARGGARRRRHLRPSPSSTSGARPRREAPTRSSSAPRDLPGGDARPGVPRGPVLRQDARRKAVEFTPVLRSRVEAAARRCTSCSTPASRPRWPPQGLRPLFPAGAVPARRDGTPAHSAIDRRPRPAAPNSGGFRLSTYHKHCSSPRGRLSRQGSREHRRAGRAPVPPVRAYAHLGGVVCFGPISASPN